MICPSTIDELRQAVVEQRRVKIRGGGTKPALSAEATISTAQLCGVQNYDPGEYTFTAMAGTPLSEIRDMLDEHGQFLAFDPLWCDAGATLGGAVAASASGSGRLRFGGVRDFLLGARLITGEGRIVFGGGKVVKNAAGFDIPKLMVGALGRYGVMAELTFKVFPRPESFATLAAQCESFEAAVQLQSRIAMSPLEPFCLDLLPDHQLLIRVGGLKAAQAARLERLTSLCQSSATVKIIEEDAKIWRAASELSWATGDTLVRLPVSPTAMRRVHEHAIGINATVRFSVGGNVAWIAGDALPLGDLQEMCEQLGQVATVIRGFRQPRIGKLPGRAFRRKLRSVFDPQSKLHPSMPAEA